MPRRGENIRKRADGRWEARYIKGYGPDKKAKYGYLYAKSYAEARKKKAEALSACMLGTFVPDGAIPTLSRAMLSWLKNRSGQVKQSTFCQYSHIAHNHLLPALGAYPINKITASVIEQYVQEKQRQGRLDGSGGLSSKTIADQVNLLRCVLRYAASQNWVPSNIATIYMPKAGKTAPEVLSDISWSQLNLYLRAHLNNYNLGILIAMHMGLRIGEVCGLRFSDIDFSSGTLSVNRTVLRIKNTDEKSPAKTKLLIQSPKTECSERNLPVPRFLLQLLNNFSKTADFVDSYVISGTVKCMEPRAFYRKYQSTLKDCKLSKHTFHALRHSFATRCIEQGCDPKTLSEILGHSSIKITLERYVHPSMHSKRMVVERIAEMD